MDASDLLATQSSLTGEHQPRKDPIFEEVGPVPEDNPRGCPLSYTHVQVCPRGYPWTLNTYMIKKSHYTTWPGGGGGVYKQVY